METAARIGTFAGEYKQGQLHGGKLKGEVKKEMRNTSLLVRPSDHGDDGKTTRETSSLRE